MATPLEAFISTPLEERLARHLKISPEREVLELFRSVAAEVPACGDFLKRQAIDPARVQTPVDFQKLPLLTKQNDMLSCPLPQLCRNGRPVFSSSALSIKATMSVDTNDAL